MKLSYTIYVKQRPLPLVGDEHYPDGCVGITFPPTPSITRTELQELITELCNIWKEMGRG